MRGATTRRTNPYLRHCRCKFPQVVRVYSASGELVAGLCVGCDQQVPATEALVWGVDRS